MSNEDLKNNTSTASTLGRLNVVERVVAVVVAAGVGYTTLTANSLDNQLKNQKGQLERQKSQLDDIGRRQELALSVNEDVREGQKHSNELIMSVYKEFVEVIKDSSSDRQYRLDRLNGILVLSNVIPDPDQRAAMALTLQKSMDRISKGASEADRSKIEEIRFDSEEIIVQAKQEQKTQVIASADAASSATVSKSTNASVTWGNYDFDIFYCEGQKGSSSFIQKANAVAALKSKDPHASGRWRVRPLPAAINARSGYGISGTQIRTSSSDEANIARALKPLMEGTGIAEVKIRSTVQDTAWYLSVFICG